MPRFSDYSWRLVQLREMANLGLSRDSAHRALAKSSLDKQVPTRNGLSTADLEGSCRTICGAHKFQREGPLKP
jgi:hypothetical protein